MPRPGEFGTLDELPSASMNALPGGVLGYAQRTTAQTGITGEVDLTGLSVTVDVPAGRRIKITSYTRCEISTGVPARTIVRIVEGSTRLQHSIMSHERAGNPGQQTHHSAVVVAPSSGAHTYKLTGEGGDSGVMTMTAATTGPAFIAVEDIGPA